MELKKITAAIFFLVSCISIVNATGITSPATGDKNAIMLIIGVMVSGIAIIALGVYLFLRKKK